MRFMWRERRRWPFGGRLSGDIDPLHGIFSSYFGVSNNTFAEKSLFLQFRRLER